MPLYGSSFSKQGDDGFFIPSYDIAGLAVWLNENSHSKTSLHEDLSETKEFEINVNVQFGKFLRWGFLKI
jgi:hypothetical protein